MTYLPPPPPVVGHAGVEPRRLRWPQGLGRRSAPLLLAFGFVLAGATDWELVARQDDRVVETMCAKTQASCEMAIAAIQRKPKPWFAPERVGDALACEARAGCFSVESDYIRGFNDPR